MIRPVRSPEDPSDRGAPPVAAGPRQPMTTVDRAAARPNSDGREAMFDFSPIQIIIVLVIALAVFGPKRLPEMGRSLGRGLREFKGSITGDHKDDHRDETRPAGAPQVDMTKTEARTPAKVEDDEADELLVGASPATSARV